MKYAFIELVNYLKEKWDTEELTDYPLSTEFKGDVEVLWEIKENE